VKINMKRSIISVIGGKLFYDLKTEGNFSFQCISSEHLLTFYTTQFFSFLGSPSMNPDVKSSIF